MLMHTRRFIKDYLPGTGAWYSWGLLTLVFTIGITLSIPILDGRLALGTWQGIYLWEHRRRGSTRRCAVHVGE